MVVIYFGNLMRFTHLNEIEKGGSKLIEFKMDKNNKIF